MRRQEISNKQIFYIKLLLLLIGILVLLFLLSKDKTLEEEKLLVNTEEAPTVEFSDEPERESDTKDNSSEITSTPAYAGVLRVLLKTNEYKGTIHEMVELCSGNEMQIATESGTDCGSAAELTISWEDSFLIFNGEVLADVPDYFVVTPMENNGNIAATESTELGGISIPSIQRSSGTPSYQGTLEIWPVEGGFVLINEVPLETYLSYVVPSEMPSGYSAEALKAQAVCARTYAWKHLQSYGYPEYEAHVDDSVSYQVYNNQGIAESTTLAVQETSGQILTYEGQPITAYYFSTSCGYTGDEEVWLEGDAALTPYLQGKTVNEAGEALQMNEEAVFASFIKETDETCFDSSMSWYRWETELDKETLESRLPVHVGNVQGIEVLERNSGGALHKICIHGKKDDYIVETEYEIRSILNVRGEEIIRADGSVAEGGSLLPSAYMVITPICDQKGTLTGFSFLGGGFGHGVGMSQNAANEMAKQGKTYEEILQFFYTGVDLTNLLSL